MNLHKYLIACAACLTAMPANAAIFSFQFAFPYGGIADIPGSVGLASNSFVTTQVSVAGSRLSLYRLRQTNSDHLAPSALPAGTDVDLVLGSNRFDIQDQPFDLAGQLVSTFDYAGGFLGSLGLVFNDGGDVYTYYADLPFEFYVDASADYSGIGPWTGTSDVIYFTLPDNQGHDSGLYRLQAAIPEPAGWAMMIVGFGLLGSAVRRREKIHVTFG